MKVLLLNILTLFSSFGFQIFIVSKLRFGDQRLLPRRYVRSCCECFCLSVEMTIITIGAIVLAIIYHAVHTMQFSQKVTTCHHGSYRNLCEVFCRNPFTIRAAFAAANYERLALALYYNPN